MKSMKRTALAAVALGALLLAGCSGTPTSAPTGDAGGDTGLGPLVIESYQALSGAAAPVGEAMSIGNRAAVTVLNDAGGVFGKPVEINITDSAGSADQLAAKLQELLASSQPHAVLPGSGSEMPAGIPILANAGVFTSHHFPGNTFNDPVKYPLAFGNAHTTASYVNSFTNRLVELNYESVAIIYSDDASGQAFHAVAVPALEAAGIEATFGAVAPTAVDATPQLQQVLAGNPDALVLTGYTAAAVPVLAARSKLGVTTPTIAAQTFAANNLSSVSPSELEGIEFQYLAANVKGTPATSTDGYAKFYEAVVEEAGGTLEFPINTYLVAYNDVILSAYAAILSDSLDPKKMAAAIEGATAEDMPLYTMPAGFSNESHYPLVGVKDFVFIPFTESENGMVVMP